VTAQRRWWIFNGIGAVGIGVQLGSLLLLTQIGVPYPIATPGAVGLAVVHNFLAHRTWTWHDRPGATGPGTAPFVRFALGNGLVSLAGNTLLMPLLVSGASLPLVLANLIAIATCGLLNYWVGDRLVFAA
jgi:putative flippase GtrA